ncbi:MAG TPA: pyrroline-5-carboxylate reductase [Burkholderiales bacterium]|nr:pyrroline-5-carboxylate reductase [Burkholderiales bacterium]
MNICFVGGGNMATALIGGMLQKGFDGAQVTVVEVVPEARERLARELGVRTTGDLAQGVAGADILLLAVKPQQLRELAEALRPLLGGQLVISIAAGIRAGDIARWLGGHTNLVRAMPNTPALIQAGITGLFALPQVGAGARAGAERILGAVGETLWLGEEAMMDAVTAVSGSGPAYVFYFIEALQDAAQALGFPPGEARRLAVATFLGSARLAAGSAEDAAGLRARVTSKGGTTERAIRSMDEAQVMRHIGRAVAAAAERSRELGDEFGKA